jgi:hypothetical protein
MSTAELATSYAALILADDGIDITVRRFLMHTDTSSVPKPKRTNQCIYEDQTN